jgi:energy-coupling factor transport system substrate-specific component
MIVTFVPFFIRFERRKLKGRELVILAVLGSVAALSRVPFASLPGVQPTTFVVIMTGIVFGGESGFVVGSLAALVSNIFLGEGPWTPWQMYAWGMIGLLSGVLGPRKWFQSTLSRCLFGLVSGYLFGWLMNLWEVISLHLTNAKAILALYGSSFYFDTAHALSNVLFLALFSRSWIKTLVRFKRKYGLLQREKK